MSEPYITVFDIAKVIFSDLLPHTPLTMLGINFDVHFRLQTPEQRIALGRALAPVGPWGTFGNRMEPDKKGRVGGMVSLTMQELNFDDRPGGHRNVKIEPSIQLHSAAGVYMQVNDHYTLELADGVGAEAVMSLLEKSFDKSIIEAKRIVAEMMKFASELKW